MQCRGYCGPAANAAKPDAGETHRKPSRHGFNCWFANPVLDQIALERDQTWFGPPPMLSGAVHRTVWCRPARPKHECKARLEPEQIAGERSHAAISSAPKVDVLMISRGTFEPRSLQGVRAGLASTGQSDFGPLPCAAGRFQGRHAPTAAEQRAQLVPQGVQNRVVTPRSEPVLSAFRETPRTGSGLFQVRAGRLSRFSH